MRSAVLLFAAALAWAASAAAESERWAECPSCAGGQESLGALRQRLGPGFRLELVAEPVFGGRILVADGGRPGDGRPVLLLVHGLGQNGLRDWLPILPALARDYRILALDLPGFGFSDKPAGKYSPGNYARVLDWLARERGAVPALVMGHSLGGAVALRYAAEHPVQLSQLVLIDAAGLLERTAFLKHMTALPPLEDFGLRPLQRLGDGLRRLGESLVEKAAGLPDPTNLLAGSDAVWGEILRDRSNANAAMALVQEDFSEAVYPLPLPLPLPVDLVWGEDDRVAPLRTGKVLAGRLPQARLHVLPGVGHNPMAEAPDRLAARLLPLLGDELWEKPAAAEAAGGVAPDLDCRDERGRTYHGRYRRIRLDGCTEIRLLGVQAQSLELRRARVEAEDLELVGGEVALRAEGSVLRLSNGRLEGHTAVVNSGSRLDLAGVSLKAGGSLLVVERSARFLFSLCEADSPEYRGYLHGNRQLDVGRYAR